jgi:hypothetical protein
MDFEYSQYEEMKLSEVTEMASSLIYSIHIVHKY